jgi:hypothetical protein
MVRVGRLHFWVRKAAVCELAPVHRQRDISELRIGGWSGSMEIAESEDVPPIVGSLFSWKSLFTKRITSEDCKASQLVFRIITLRVRVAYLSYCCLT